MRVLIRLTTLGFDFLNRAGKIKDGIVLIMQGTLIVIDGADGSGKATQSRLLVERLNAYGQSAELLDFPRYNDNVFGKLLRECLDGKRGDFMALDARIASALYAADRYESRTHIERWLEEGKVVVLDRYVSANMMHQGAKIGDAAEANEFLSWLDHMEHTVFGLPRPDAIFYLEVPYAVRRALMERDSMRHAIDTAEINHEHQIACEKRAKDIVAEGSVWQLISCVAEGTMRPKEEIHEEIFSRVRDLL